MIIKINKVLLLLSFLFLIVLFIFSKEAALGAKNGLFLSIKVIIPTLFPFTVISLFFTNLGGFYYLSKIIGVKFSLWLLSAIGGYPMGALIINELKEEINEDFLKKSLFFSINAGPSFVINAIGTALFKSAKIGYILLLAHLIASFIVCLFVGSKNIKITKYNKDINATNLFFKTLYIATENMLKITASVMFASTIIELVKSIDFLKNLSLFLEVTSGIYKADKNLYFIVFLLGFSGVSVILQVKTILGNFNKKITSLIFERLVIGLISVLVLKILLLFFDVSITTISNNVSFINKPYVVSVPSGISLILMCVFYAYCTLNKQNYKLKLNN